MSLWGRSENESRTAFRLVFAEVRVSFQASRSSEFFDNEMYFLSSDLLMLAAWL